MTRPTNDDTTLTPLSDPDNVRFEIVEDDGENAGEPDTPRDDEG